MASQINVCPKKLSAFWTFKVFDLAVSKRVAFEVTVGFERFFTLSALEVPRRLMDALVVS
jgi:hypothetical protein